MTKPEVFAEVLSVAIIGLVIVALAVTGATCLVKGNRSDPNPYLRCLYEANRNRGDYSVEKCSVLPTVTP